MSAKPTDKSCLRIAHRGGAGHGPENTLLAMDRALAMGADVIEADVRLTADDQLVVLHDAYLERTTDGVGALRDLRLSDLAAVRTREGGQPLPTLLQVLDRLSGRADLMLELKVFGMAASVVAAVRQSGFQGRVLYASFLHAELLATRALDPAAATIALFEGAPVHPTAFLADSQATHVGLAVECLDSRFAHQLHEAGFLVFTYTADDPRDIAHAKSCHVDGIISNFIDRL